MASAISFISLMVTGFKLKPTLYKPKSTFVFIETISVLLSEWPILSLFVRSLIPKIGYKRLILSHNKQLNKGDYLIDDRRANGVTKFEGKHIYFGKGNNKDWMAVYRFFIFKNR